MKRLLLLASLLTGAFLAHAAPPVKAAAAEPQTLITSQTMEWQGTALHNFFYFEGDVKVEGADLNLTCERLSVTTGAERAEAGTVGAIGAVEEIIAEGKVHILQAGREAFAGRAEMNAAEGRIVLRRSPKVIQGKTVISGPEGYMLVMDKGEMKIRLVPDPDAPPPAKGERSTLRLGALPSNLSLPTEAEATTGRQLGEQAEVPATEPAEAPKP